MRRHLAASFLVLFVTGPVRADEDSELTIKEFHFTWTVAKAGNTKFLIEKDEKATRAGLRHGARTISMSLEDAQALGEALARTNEFSEKFKGKKGQIETLGAGKIVVEFQTADQGDFRVCVSPEKSILVFATLKPTEAKALAGPMKKAVQAAALVDRKVKF